MAFLKSISISGFKSIEQMDLDLRPFNVLIGANGAGKSNLISFFKLIYEMRQGRLQNFVANWGADALLCYGAKVTDLVEGRFRFDDVATGPIEYRVLLKPTARDSFLPLEYITANTPKGQARFACGATEPALESELRIAIEVWLRDASEDAQTAGRAAAMVVRTVQNWGIFHFHDTSATARIRKRGYIHDDQNLHSDGGNLAAFLRGIQVGYPTFYPRILETIRLIAPWFGDFALEPLKANENDVLLNWRDRHSDTVFGPHQLPDGTLRAMALIALLLQPERQLPSLVVVDEPELGLHPYALNAIAGLLKGASHHCQVVVATQSASFLDQCDPEDVIVVEREEGKSAFRRLDAEPLRDWLEEYSLGELWQKNVFGGGPF